MNTIKTVRPIHVPGMWPIAVGGLLALVAGCADPFHTADDEQWHSARVIRVINPLELDDSVNTRCLDGLARKPEQVAVVKVRIHRAPSIAAFALPAQGKVQENDRVLVNFRFCQLRPGAGEASQ